MSATLHLWSRYRVTDPRTRLRQQMAMSSWGAQPWIEVPVHNAALPRLFEEGARRLPYVRDLFDAGCAGRAIDDMVVFSNSDIGFCFGAGSSIRRWLGHMDAGYSNRRNFPMPICHLPTLLEMKESEPYTGTDSFFFRVSWWRKHRDEFPDMVLGRWLWDGVMRDLMCETHGGVHDLLIPDITWHESHGNDPAHWYQESNRLTLPGQVHNLQVALEWFKAHGIDPAAHDVPAECLNG